ncbi:MAG: hypothetical protein ACON5H_05920 [Akkermansiaceae bacterium]
MANTFGILAAVALLFGAFVSFKNKQNLEEVDSAIATEENTNAKQTKVFDGLVENIGELVAEQEGYDKTKEESQAALDKQIEENKSLETQIEAKKQEADAAQAKADEAEEVLKEVGDIKTLIAEMKTLGAELEELDDEISLNSAVVDRLEGNKNETKEQTDQLAKILKLRTSGSSYFKSTQVRSVYRQWGFVTLAGGDNIGVVKKSKLSVQREGEEIAQLIVTGVEPNSAAASLIPTSIKDGVSVSPGDTVVPLAEDAEAQSAAE